jgi:hypothetical protein
MMNTKTVVKFAMIGLLFHLCFLSTVLLGQVNVTTYHNDNSRTGQNLKETILTLANVNPKTFGKLFYYPVKGYVYAQPLYLQNVTIPGKGVHNVVYVATEQAIVYAFDADSNAGANATPLWLTSFINPAKGITAVTSNEVACTDLVPTIGITSTPVIDTTTNTIYVVAKTREKGQYFQRLHALDVTTGAEKFGGPKVIQAQVKGSGDGGTMVTFNPLMEAQRPGLLLQNGQVLIGWASHCDIPTYYGWIMAYDAHTLAQVAVWNATPNAGYGGIWQSGGGLAGDASFNTYFATGNGQFDVGKNGGGGVDYGDSIVKLSPPSAGSFTVASYFTPFDQSSLSGGDTDLGSGGLVLLPDQPLGSPHQHLLAQSGKEGTLYLVNRDSMGQYNPSNNSQIVQNIPGSNGGMWSSPAWWNNTLYIGGNGDNLKAFSFDPVMGKFNTSPSSATSTFYNYPPATPSISANGNSNAILWAIQTEGFSSNKAEILHAYNATNLAELFNSTQGTGNYAGGAVKYAVPTIANGKVYFGAVARLNVYGLLSAKPAAQSAGR